MAQKRDKAPAYQWYPKDWDTDEAVKLMTYEEEGVYRRLLDHQWLHGSIPADPDRLARLLPKMPAQAFRRVWDAIKDKFKEIGAGRLANARLERQRTESHEFSDGRAQNGRSGAEARWRKDSHQESDGEPMAVPSERDSGAIVLPLAKNGSASASSSASAIQEIARASGPPRSPTRHVGGGAMAGALPREHLTHAFCDETMSRCVPAAVHDKLSNLLAPKHNGDREAAGCALRVWYPQACLTLAPEFVMGDAFRFWQRLFDHQFASKAPDPAVKVVSVAPPRGCRHAPLCRSDADHTSRYLAEQRAQGGVRATN